jgi:uncharacterized membrane protein
VAFQGTADDARALLIAITSTVVTVIALVLGLTVGYIQTVYPLLLLPMVSEGDVTICLRKRVGEHVVAGTVIGWVWAPSRGRPTACCLTL